MLSSKLVKCLLYVERGESRGEVEVRVSYVNCSMSLTGSNGPVLDIRCGNGDIHCAVTYIVRREKEILHWDDSGIV